MDAEDIVSTVVNSTVTMMKTTIVPIEILNLKRRNVRMGATNMDCIFCDFPKERIILEGENSFATFSWYPVSELHTLIIPKRHVDDQNLSHSEVLDIFILKSWLIHSLGLQEYNFGVNNGKSAGQTVFHTHYHLIPRSPLDTPTPRGGIRWVIPSKAIPDGDPQKELVEKWTQRFKAWVK